MYKRAYIFLVLFIACIQFMQAQKSYSIKGIVKEAASGEPVPYATVAVSYTHLDVYKRQAVAGTIINITNIITNPIFFILYPLFHEQR